MMSNHARTKFKLLPIIAVLAVSHAHALELDWSGQFRTEYHYIKNYTMDSSDTAQQPDANRIIGVSPNQLPSGYYVPGGGSDNASFETLLLKLQPKVIVNDNIVI